MSLNQNYFTRTSLQTDTIMTPHDQLIQSSGKSVEVDTTSGADPKVYRCF
jgi:hypothetical protein